VCFELQICNAVKDSKLVLGAWSVLNHELKPEAPAKLSNKSSSLALQVSGQKPEPTGQLSTELLAILPNTAVSRLELVSPRFRLLKYNADSKDASNV